MSTMTAMDAGDGLELGKDGLLRKGARLARPDDVAIRLDLPVGHPLRGTRALRGVPSGMGDMIIGADSRLAPIAEAKPLEEPLADREITRVR